MTGIDRKHLKSLVAKIREAAENGTPYTCTFVEGIDQQNKALVEKQLGEKFRIFCNSWILPYCNQLDSDISETD